MSLLLFYHTGPTAKAAVNTNASLDADTTYLIRVRVQNAGHAGSTSFRWEYNHASGGATPITTTSTHVKAVAAATFANNDDVPELLGPGLPYVANNDAASEDGTITLPANFAADSSIEFVLAFQLVGANVSNAQTGTIRLTLGTGTALDAYTNTFQYTVVKAATTVESADTLTIALADSGALAEGELEQVASTSADVPTTVTDPRDFTVTVPTGTGRVILDFLGWEAANEALVFTDTIDPGGGEQAALTQELYDGEPVGGESLRILVMSLLEADMPTGPTETLRFDQDDSGPSSSKRGFRQVVTVRGAAQVVHKVISKVDSNANTVVVTVSRTGGGNFATGSLFWALVWAEGSTTWAVTGDATEVRDTQFATDGNTVGFAHGTLGAPAASMSATFTREVGTATITKIAAGIVLEPALGAEAASGSDAIAVALAETATLAAAVASTDTASLALTDSGALAATATGADSVAVAVSEAGALAATAASTDAFAVSLAETAVLTVPRAGSDALALATSETATRTAALSGSDTLTLALTDSAALTVPVASTDSIGIVLSEVAARAAQVAASDTLTLAVAEVGTLPGLPIAGSDTIALALADTATASAALAGIDALVVAASDVAALAAAHSTSDSLTVALPDAAALKVNAVDTVALTLSESGAVSTARFGVDAVSVGISEAAAVSVQVSGTDTLSLALSESGAVAATAATSDSLALMLAEAAALTVPVAASDALALATSEVGVVSLARAASDTITVATAESGSRAAAVQGLESLALSLTEMAVVPTAILTGLETLGLIVVEQPFPTVPLATADALNIETFEVGVTGGTTAKVIPLTGQVVLARTLQGSRTTATTLSGKVVSVRALQGSSPATELQGSARRTRDLKGGVG